jgi:hypothetical protein
MVAVRALPYKAETDFVGFGSFRTVKNSESLTGLALGAEFAGMGGR